MAQFLKRDTFYYSFEKDELGAEIKLPIHVMGIYDGVTFEDAKDDSAFRSNGKLSLDCPLDYDIEAMLGMDESGKTYYLDVSELEEICDENEREKARLLIASSQVDV